MVLSHRLEKRIRDGDVRILPTFPGRDTSVSRPHSVGGLAEMEWIDETL